MLLYDNNSNRDIASINYINQGLEQKLLCIYASVNAYNTSHLTKISSQIKDYEENVRKRNLLIVNLKPFYDSALAKDLTPFEEFKMQLQQELKDRDGKGVLIIADCADNLFRNKHFDQCNLVEKWWEDIYIKWRHRQEKEQNHITVICPYLGSLLSRHPFDQHKHHISHNHSIAIDMTGCILTGYPTVKGEEIEVAESAVSSIDLSTRVLVAEPEPDLQQIYNIWLHSMGFKEVVITDSGKECLDEIPTIIAVNKSVNKNKNKTQEFDMIILDTHLKDIPYVQVAKEIVNRTLDQRIIFTTTLPSDRVRQDIDSMGIKDNKNEILTKPFRFSKLLSLICRSIKS